MSKINIQIEASPRQFEVANFLLKQACDALKKPELLKKFDLTKEDLKDCEKFRQLIVSSFIKNSIV